MRSGRSHFTHLPHKPRRGAAAVEFAVVCPIICLMLGGIIEIGQAFQIEHSLSNAARRGVRTAISPGTTSNEVSQEVKTHCAELLKVAEADIGVVISLNGTANAEIGTAIEDDEIGVTVQVPFSKAGVGFFSYLFDGTTLSSSCVLERE
jgi:Flp pilus assembly protein TadG